LESSLPRSLTHQKNKSFFLFGARGTGKTTWTRTALANPVIIDLLDSSTYTRLLADPSSLRSHIPLRHKGPVVIDEVQRIPDLLNEVHRLIEQERLWFALTGSSARKLRRGGVNLLAGRALTYHMFPLTAVEQAGRFDLTRSLRYGHLPAVLSEPDPEKFLASYVETYLREEVQQEGLTRNLAGFARFLQAASFSHAALLNVSAVARECAVERKVVENYFSILVDLLLAVRLEPFTRRAKRKSVGHPKFYFFDAGVYQAIRPRGPLDRPEDIAGAALEGLVLQEIRAVNEYLGLGYGIHYWRTPGGLEVDLVLHGERGLLAIEVKHTGRLRGDDLKGILAFREDYPSAHCLIFYMGQRREVHSGIEAIPTAEALAGLPALLAGSGVAR
jgi:predicted AAA+ superfamily ATPase